MEGGEARGTCGEFRNRRHCSDRRDRAFLEGDSGSLISLVSPGGEAAPALHVKSPYEGRRRSRSPLALDRRTRPAQTG